MLWSTVPKIKYYGGGNKRSWDDIRDTPVGRYIEIGRSMYPGVTKKDVGGLMVHISDEYEEKWRNIQSMKETDQGVSDTWMSPLLIKVLEGE